MHAVLSRIRTHPLFRPAMAAPVAIMLIFSLFNLTAPPDSGRMAASVTLAIVNEDEGLTFPPLKISARMIAGIDENLPFGRAEYPDRAQARTALETGDVSAVLVFPPDFSASIAEGGDVQIGFMNAEHLSLIEAQMGGQMPMMVQAAFSAAVGVIRDALANGRLPDGAMPVTAEVETLHPAPSPAARIAPMIMVSASWLAALVGGLLLSFASHGAGRPMAVAAARTVLPVAVSGLAAALLAVVLVATLQDGGLFLTAWLSVWAVVLALSWLMGGLFALAGPAGLLLGLPLAFYQMALGGAQAPASAAPEWLQAASLGLPFDAVGRFYRQIVLADGGLADMPLIPWAVAAAIGLGLIILGSALRRGKAP